MFVSLMSIPNQRAMKNSGIWKERKRKCFKILMFFTKLANWVHNIRGDCDKNVLFLLHMVCVDVGVAFYDVLSLENLRQ